MSILRKITADTARKNVAALEEVGVPAPEETRALLDRLDRLEAHRPTAPDIVALVAAYLDAEPDDQIETKAALQLTHPARHEAWTEARIKLGQQITASLTSNGDDLTAQLAALAAPLIEKLTAAAKLDTLDTTALIRAGDRKGADLAARVDIYAGDLERLYALRDKITRGADYGTPDCRRWKDPRPVIAANNLRARAAAGAETFLRGLQAGAELWFPTPGEAATVARTVEAQVVAEAAKAEAENRGRGYNTGMAGPRSRVVTTP